MDIGFSTYFLLLLFLFSFKLWSIDCSRVATGRNKGSLEVVNFVICAKTIFGKCKMVAWKCMAVGECWLISVSLMFIIGLRAVGSLTFIVWTILIPVIIIRFFVFLRLFALIMKGVIAAVDLIVVSFAWIFTIWSYTCILFFIF